MKKVYFVGMATVSGIVACSGDPGRVETSQPSTPVPEVTQARAEWHGAMARKPLGAEGCFKASYPSTEWQRVPCVNVPAPSSRIAPSSTSWNRSAGLSGPNGPRARQEQSRAVFHGEPASGAGSRAGGKRK